MKNETEVTGPALRALRERLGLGQKEFWQALGITQSGGSRYEIGQPMPKAVRILAFASYVVGLRIDATTDVGVRQLFRLADMRKSEIGSSAEKIGAKIGEAQRAVREVAKLLQA